ncbi:MAG: cytochrome c family protein [Planctomycetota bacterium]|jgi:hypothetical protein
MKLRLTLVLAIGLGALGLWIGRGPSPAVAGVEPSTGAAAALALAASDALQASEEEGAYSYVGIKKCKSCHLDVHKSWTKTKMGQAFESLEAGHAQEIKEQHGLDPNKDYTQEAACLKCHTVGYGKPGGYVPPDPGDRRAVRKAKDLQGVGCESCHGAGSEYVKIFQEIDKSQRSYKVEELYAAGMRKVDKSVCVECHNKEGPTFSAAEPFDYEKVMAEEEAKEEGINLHFHKALKLREG